MALKTYKPTTPSQRHLVLIDRTNPKLALIAGLLLGALGFAVAAMVDSYWVLIAMFGVVGLGVLPAVGPL